MTRSEALNGAKVFDFSVSPGLLTDVKISLFFVPDGGATITELKVNGDNTNVLSTYSNTGVLLAGETIAVAQGEYIHEILGTAGHINYVGA